MYVCFRCHSTETLLRAAEELNFFGKLRLVTYVGCRDCGLWVNRLEYPKPPQPPQDPSITTASYAVICPTGCRLHNVSTLLENQRLARKASRKTPGR